MTIGNTSSTQSSTLPVVHLRAMEPEDLDFLYDIENDTNVWQVGVTNVPYSRYLLHDYIAQSTGDIYADGQVRLIVEDDTHQTIGLLDIINFSPTHQRAEIGIVISKNHRQRGYAKATLQEICRYAHRILHLHQLYAVISESNEVAIRLFNKQGFEKNNTLKDWLFDGENYQNAYLFSRFL